MLKITVAQLNYTVGDIDGNVRNRIARAFINNKIDVKAIAVRRQMGISADDLRPHLELLILGPCRARAGFEGLEGWLLGLILGCADERTALRCQLGLARSQVAQMGDLFDGHIAPLAHGQVAHGEEAEGLAGQADDRVPDGLAHVLHLAVAALRQDDL